LSGYGAVSGSLRGGGGFIASFFFLGISKLLCLSETMPVGARSLASYRWVEDFNLFSFFEERKHDLSVFLTVIPKG
jgi:hypothetical protein